VRLTNGYEVISYIGGEATTCRSIGGVIRGGRVKTSRVRYHTVRGTLDCAAWRASPEPLQVRRQAPKG